MNNEQQVLEFLKKTLPEKINQGLVEVAPMSPEAAKAFKDMLAMLNGEKPNE